ncbi:hypothetical protein [Dysgonomonas termitidis]|uniref:Uncharacterized protein n=1 Tax=Dysgonomonas termitidis TaxID=1516126 RepID=A0ABV9L2L1_9BACT
MPVREYVYYISILSKFRIFIYGMMMLEENGFRPDGSLNPGVVVVVDNEL